ncbi:hypothetical protein Acsp03_22880 [Actinomadura sp. NBRC 104412]|nr:hypothetical protein Acsp03_22880 [Actinomadura sp. NBRC 104412]
MLPAGLPSARETWSQMAGMAISAPMAKKTAAMTTLGNCIAILPARGRARPLRPAYGRVPRSLLTQARIVLVSPDKWNA